MKNVSFELTMPNVGSWNGKWTGADKKYYIIKRVSNKFYKDHILPLLEPERNRANFYYNFGDGWGANVQMEIVTSEMAKRRKLGSSGFCGYEWMVDSIISHGRILSSTEIKAIKNEQTKTI